MAKLSDRVDTYAESTARDMVNERVKATTEHKIIIQGYIDEYETRLAEIDVAFKKKKELLSKRHTQNDWKLSVSIGDLIPLYAAKNCNMVGIYEEEDIKVFWMMGLHKLIRRNRERKITFQATNLLQIGYNRTMDVLRELKIAKRGSSPKCVGCKKLEKRIPKCKECKIERIKKNPPKPTIVDWDEVQDYANVDFLMYDFIDILGAESFAYSTSMPQRV